MWRPRTAMGWLQVLMAIAFMALLALSLFSVGGEAVLAGIPLLGAAAIVLGSRNRGWQRSFSDSIARTRIKVAPWKIYAGGWIGIFSLLVAARLLIWLFS